MNQNKQTLSIQTNTIDNSIDNNLVNNFLNYIDNEDICLHSAILMQHSKICAEVYYSPYDKNRLHRMFSITKSLVSLGIGILISEGKLSLDDNIVDYFPDKLPENGAHPFMQMLTIKNMLEMKTCHNVNTYKADTTYDWVGSFFNVTPSHIPGTNFSYDTASTHTLGILIQRITGMSLMEFFRDRFLDEIGVSKEAYILKNQYGEEMGGSGLVATPMDILKIMQLIVNKGVYNNKQLIPADYIENALQNHSNTYVKSSTIEEMKGYGWQFWLSRNGGYYMYGMGGQYALYVPDKDILMITTADTQGRSGGGQVIFDAFWNEIYDKISSDISDNDISDNDISDNDISDNDISNTDISNIIETFTPSKRDLFYLHHDISSPVIDKINGKTYTFYDNKCGFSKMRFSFYDTDKFALNDTDKQKNGTLNDNSKHKKGTLTYANKSGEHVIHFGLGYNEFQNESEYELFCGVSAAFPTPDNLLIKMQILDYAIGSVCFNITFKDDYITVFLKKNEETMFNDYNGILCGKVK